LGSVYRYIWLGLILSNGFYNSQFYKLKNFREISFVCPDDKVVVSYTKTVKTLYDEITSKAKENQSLINLRDTLLPKLMSGEISLNKNMGSIDD